MVQLDDGTQQELNVNWNADTYDSQKEGKQTLTGVLVTGESLMNPKNYTASIQIQVGMTADEYLNRAIEKAKGLQETDYTADSWEKLQEKLQTALALKENPEVTEEQKKEAAENLEKAVAELVSAADKEMLKQAIEEGKKKQEQDYTEESWNRMVIALNEARAVLVDPKMNQEMVDQAYQKLREALDGLVGQTSGERPNAEVLEEIIKKAESLDRTAYTEDSWEAVQDALDAARAVLQDLTATQTDYDTAQKTLEEAMAALQFLPGGNGNGDTTGGIAGDGTSNGSDAGNQVEQNSAVQTGDSMDFGKNLFLIVMSIGFMCLETAIYSKRKK